MTFSEFLDHCTAYGGNWSAMLMSGIKEVAPEVFAQMPDRDYAFDEVCFIVNHLCSDRPHLRYNLSLEGEIIEHTPEGTFAFRKATPEECAMTPLEFEKKYNCTL